MQSRQLIIAGFHRSGTSLVAQLLSTAGLFLGDELLEALPSNPYGHFEDVDFVHLHEAILRDNQQTWITDEVLVPVITQKRWDEMSELVYERTLRFRLWGFKDPRVCLFLNQWKYLLPAAKVLMVYRHYSESAYSLERRHSEELFASSGPPETHRRFWREPDLALRMWLRYNQALIQFAERHPEDVYVISLDMLRSGIPLITELNGRWGLDLETIPTLEVLDPSLALRRRGRQPIADDRLIPRLRNVWDTLEGLQAHHLTPEARHAG